MKRVRLFAQIPLLLVCLVILLGFYSAPAKAQGTFTWLGGVNLEKWCHDKGGVRLYLQGTTAYSWRCAKQDGTLIPVSVLQACRDQYMDPAALDRLGNYKNPYSWGCFTHAKFSEVLKAEDFGNYCKSLGHSWMQYGDTTDTLRCITLSGRAVLEPITPVFVCQWKHPKTAVIDRVLNYFDPLSIGCWVGV